MSQLTVRYGRSGVITPVETINTAPSQAAAGRFNGRILSLSAADENVSDREDDGCDKLLLPVIHSACITDWVSRFNEHNFFAKLSRNA